MSPRRTNGRWWMDPKYVPTEVRTCIEDALADHWRPDREREIERRCAKWCEAMSGVSPSPYRHKVKHPDPQIPGIGRMAEGFARLIQLEEHHRALLREIRELRGELRGLKWASRPRSRSQPAQDGGGHAAG